MSSISLKELIVLSETKKSIRGRLLGLGKLSIVRRVSVNNKVYDVRYTRETYQDDCTENNALELILSSEGQKYKLYVDTFYHSYNQDVDPEFKQSGKIPFKIDSNTIFILTGDEISNNSSFGCVDGTLAYAINSLDFQDFISV